jgi:spore photoproduct lyase
LSTSFTPSRCENFSHLYIEKELLDHPAAVAIQQRFSGAKIITIKHYKDIFNRQHQSFRAQSRSKNLILAKKEAPFFYKGSYYSDGFDFEHFFYTPGLPVRL